MPFQSADDNIFIIHEMYAMWQFNVHCMQILIEHPFMVSCTVYRQSTKSDCSDEQHQKFSHFFLLQLTNGCVYIV